MKTTYTATFSNNRVATRTTAKVYGGAYIVTVDGGKKIIAIGFSATVESAEKIAAREVGIQMRNGYGDQLGRFADRGPAFEVVATK